MRTGATDREELFERIVAGGPRGDEFLELVDALDLQHSLKLARDLAENWKQLVTDMLGMRERFSEQIDRLERGSGTDGWIGALNAEATKAVQAVQKLTEEASSMRPQKLRKLMRGKFKK